MNVKSKYSSTQTEKNLLEAFAGNLQARNRYTYCASVIKARVQTDFRSLYQNGRQLKVAKNEMSIDNRMRCLQDLKSTGFQTCGGFMVGRRIRHRRCLSTVKQGRYRNFFYRAVAKMRNDPCFGISILTTL